MVTRLSNLITTRSDSFTVYIVVQGWRNAGTATPELGFTTSARGPGATPTARAADRQSSWSNLGWSAVITSTASENPQSQASPALVQRGEGGHERVLEREDFDGGVRHGLGRPSVLDDRDHFARRDG